MCELDAYPEADRGLLATEDDFDFDVRRGCVNARSVAKTLTSEVNRSIYLSSLLLTGWCSEPRHLAFI